MRPSLRISATGLDAQQTNMSVISNNLANVSTTGFKRDKAVFEDLIYQNVRQAGAQSTQDTELPSGLEIGTGVKIVATNKLHSQGSLSKTDNQLDLAIQGQGFFQILHPDGSTVYTRDGEFSLSAEGTIVTSEGFELDPTITVPADTLNITIGSDGIVSALVAGDTAPTQIGQITLANFINPTGLEPIGMQPPLSGHLCLLGIDVDIALKRRRGADFLSGFPTESTHVGHFAIYGNRLIRMVCINKHEKAY